jgi:hypothetical protein
VGFINLGCPLAGGSLRDDAALFMPLCGYANGVGRLAQV